LKHWDYPANGYYFLTLVSQNRRDWFGEIDNEKPIYSEFGKIVLNELKQSTNIRQELFLDKYILMPNHLHVIVIIYKNHPVVETHGHASLQHTQRVFIRKPKSISSFVAGFKSATTNKIDNYIDNHNLNIEKFNRNNRLWQPNYYDRIIRNEDELHKTREYIINNPENWDNDKHNKP